MCLSSCGSEGSKPFHIASSYSLHCLHFFVWRQPQLPHNSLPTVTGIWSGCNLLVNLNVSKQCLPEIPISPHGHCSVCERGRYLPICLPGPELPTKDRFILSVSVFLRIDCRSDSNVKCLLLMWLHELKWCERMVEKNTSFIG